MTVQISDVVAQLQQKCESGRIQAATALAHAFEVPFEVELGTAIPWSAQSAPSDWNGSGLAFAFQSDDNAAVAILPDASGLVPEWCSQPDSTRQVTLRTLASALGSAFFPSSTSSPECTIGRVKNLAEAMLRTALPSGSALLPITLHSQGKAGKLWVMWPTSKAEAILAENRVSASNSGGNGQPEQEGERATIPPAKPSARPTIRYSDMDEGIRLLPPYTRSLLRIRVPVTVTLAAAKQTVNAILNIGSGSIIHFNKSCEDTLTLEVAGHKIAVGETVKVGDKFGLWITSMIMPDERFWIISNRQSPQRAR